VAFNEELADRIREVLRAQKGLDEIKMFGGLCFTINGNMCAGVIKDELLVRVAKDQFDVLVSKQGAHPMNMMKSGRAPTGFLMVAPSAIKTARQLEGWVARGTAVATSLPPKTSSRKKK
jgi:TfoX/Sxy family transcriptional regulator of competence genes